jgi:crossover junction endodeoxyribonuclease RuvC
MAPLWVLGLDLATVSGIARTHDATGQPRMSVTTVDTSGLPLHDRINETEVYIRRVCGAGSVVQRPDLVVVEGTFSRRGGGAADYPLHAVRACVLQWLHRQRVPYLEVAPATLKVWATGKGTATKRDVVARVIADYGRHLNIPADDNAADAVALMAMGLYAYGQALAEVTPEQARAVKTLAGRWPSLIGEN